MADVDVSIQGQAGSGDATIVVPDANQIMNAPGKIDGIVDTGTGLFADEARPTKDELTGSTEDGQPPAPSPETKEVAANSQPTGDDDKGKKTDAQTTEAGKDQVVPLAALHEERSKRQARDNEISQERYKSASLEAEITVLRQQLQEKPPVSTETPAEFKEFKVLTDEEFSELSDEDTQAGQKYLLKLNRYTEWKRSEDAKQAEITRNQQITQQQIADNNRRTIEIIQSAREEISSAVPGIYETKIITGDDGKQVETTPVSDALINFADQHGIDIPFLAAITDPATKIAIIGPDGKSKVMLAGKGAASLVKGLYQLYTKTNGNASVIEQEAARKAGEILANKIKTDTGYRSIGDSPGTGDIPETDRVLSEDDLFRLRGSEEGETKRRQYLGG